MKKSDVDSFEKVKVQLDSLHAEMSVGQHFDAPIQRGVGGKWEQTFCRFWGQK